jgi:hypothetical protein
MGRSPELGCTLTSRTEGDGSMHAITMPHTPRNATTDRVYNAS